MDQSITSLLLLRFNTPDARNGMTPRIIVWIDSTKEFVDIVDSLELDNVAILKWDGFNSFRIKYTVEYEKPDSKFIIYIPSTLPNDDQNILADIVHYSKPLFSADKTSLLCSELGIPAIYSNVVDDHILFFNSSERKGKFKRIEPELDNPDSIVNAMIAVALGLSTTDFKEILRGIIIAYSESPGVDSEDEIMSKLDKYNLSEDLWARCHSILDFNGTSLGELIRSMFITAATNYTPVLSSYKILSKYILSKKNTATSIVLGLLNDSRVSVQIQSLCDWIEEKMEIHKIAEDLDNQDLSEADVFQCFDNILFHRFLNQMCSTSASLDPDSTSIIEKRMSKVRGRQFEDHYKLLLAASEMLYQCSDFRLNFEGNSPTAIIDEYAKKWYSIDSSYRHFTYHSDKAGYDDIENLVKLVENVYSNVFVNPIVDKLCKGIHTYNDLPCPSITKFCSKYIKTDRKTVVIVSDAFRYECAAELCLRLGKSSRFKERKLEYMISTVPSITKFGMAALLPNEGLQVSHDGKFNVMIRGQMTASDYRETILQSVYPNSVVLNYKQFRTRSSELREHCKGKNLIYIYHDLIDSAGHESQGLDTFEACEKAFQEITDLITTVTNWNYTKFIVTADHGFLYRRGKIEEYDKIDTADGFEQNRRYALNRKSFGLNRSIEMSLDYLDESNEGLYVSVPDSAGVFKIQGAGMNFVHGGISPQEIVVPVLTIHTFKGSITEKYVGLVPDKREIKQMRPSFILWQEHPVDDEYREAQYDIWVEDSDGQFISPIQTVSANKSDASALDHRISFPIEIKEDSIYLVIKNHDDPDEEPKRYEFKVKRLYNEFI